MDHPEFTLAQLTSRIKLFGFISGYQAQIIKPQDPINEKAARRMGALHEALKASGYVGHPLEVLLVRLLFCLFADDTGIFQPAQSLRDWLEADTKPDGSDVGRALTELFDVLNTKEAERQASHKETFKSFPYINGKLFAEMHRPPAFDAKMRELLLQCCTLDWSKISPAIFGALFQSVMLDVDRRKLGAHYTSEENILKLIKPLFLDELRAEFERIKSNANKLKEFHQRLRTLTFFDPACGCGNFLVIAYRELRLLELDILRAVNDGPGSRYLDVHSQIEVNVDQFYGIEIEEFPAQIAQVALWLTDHQVNSAVGYEFGKYFARIPLERAASIHHGNALRLDWNDVLPAERCSFVLGNPPFVGAKYMSDAQRAESAAVFRDVPNGGLLDFVAAWYVKATQYMKSEGASFPPPNLPPLGGGADPRTASATSAALTVAFPPSPAGEVRSSSTNSTSQTIAFPPPPAGEGRGGGTPPAIRCAFVSTNSITQGEQVGVLWGWLLAQGIIISFAHRTFRWSNEATGKAAVHCVIIGFGFGEPEKKTIFEYDDIAGAAHPILAKNINPYLVDAPNVVLPRMSNPICDAPEIGIGNQPIDDGNYLFTTEERDEFIANEPRSSRFFLRWIGADEFLNGYERWCLWLGVCSPTELRQMPLALQRVEAVKNFREKSKRGATVKLSQTPTRFLVENIPITPYLVLPEVSSEKRNFIPFGFEQPETLASNLLKIAATATVFHFGTLSSTMHMAWVRATCGRLESRYRYSKDIVYNNYPWPDLSDANANSRGVKSGFNKQREAIELAAQGVLDARAAHPTSSLADLYDPLSMPANLVKAHQKLDAAVDAAYFAAHAADGAKKSWKSDAERVAFLFMLYQKFTSLLPSDTAKPKRARAKKEA